jgi:uncharacterized membrane protein YccC
LAQTKSSDDFDDRVVQYAERLGRLIGTVQAKTEGLLDRAALAKNLENIRDGAADLLTRLTPSTPAQKRSTRKPSPRATARDASMVAAPGKRHRTPPKPVHGIKHSDQRISKLKATQMKRGRGRQG